jgi:hypothetical protein
LHQDLSFPSVNPIPPRRSFDPSTLQYSIPSTRNLVDLGLSRQDLHANWAPTYGSGSLGAQTSYASIRKKATSDMLQVQRMATRDIRSVTSHGLRTFNKMAWTHQPLVTLYTLARRCQTTTTTIWGRKLHKVGSLPKDLSNSKC